MRRLSVLLLAALSTSVFAANYATCILDKMPGVVNEVTAHAVRQACRAEHQTGMDGVTQGSGRGFFGFKSGAECVVNKAGETHSQSAAATIGAACRKLYDESGPWLQFGNTQKLRPFTGKLDGE